MFNSKVDGSSTTKLEEAEVLHGARGSGWSQLLCSSDTV